MADYGGFALAFVVAALGMSASAALVATPLSVYTPGLMRRAPRVALETLLSSANVILVVAVSLVTLVGAAVWLRSSPATVLAFAAFVGGFTQRNYSRVFTFARRRPAIALAGDVCYIGLSSALVLGGNALRFPMSLTGVLGALAVSNAVASGLDLAALRVGLRLALRRRSLRRYAKIWHEARWALLGATTSLVQIQAHSFLVSAIAGAAAYAPLAAGQVLFGPLRIAINVWHSVMRPELAIAIAQQNRLTVGRTLRGMTILMVCVMAVLAVGLALFWQPISMALYARKYGDHRVSRTHQQR